MHTQLILGFCRGAIALAVCIIVLCGSSDAQRIEETRWTPEVSIAVRYFSDPSTDANLWQAPAADADYRPTYFTISPNGEFVAWLVHWGDLARDSNIYELSVVSLDAVRASIVSGSRPALAAHLSRETVAGRPGSFGAISWVEWTQDSRFLRFRAYPEPDDQYAELYELSLENGRVSRLTHLNELDVGPLNFNSAPGGSYPAIVQARLGTSLYNAAGFVVADFRTYPSMLLNRLATGGLQGRVRPIQRKAYAAQGRRVRIELSGQFGSGAVVGDGWEAVVRLDGDTTRDFLHLDLRRGVTRELGHASSARAQVLSTAHPERVILVGLQLREATRIAEYNTRTRQLIDIAPLPPNATASIDVTGTWLTVQTDGDAARYIRRGPAIWEEVGDAAHPLAESSAPFPHVELFLRQSINDPPTLIARSVDGEIALTAADSSLSSISRSVGQSFSWTEGQECVSGLLFTPVGQEAERLPLIIQLQLSADPSYFLPDGTAPSGFAAQSFAAANFAVLMLPVAAGATPSEEGPANVRRIDAAVEALDAEGVIDPHRVGIIGFSRTGYLSHYAATHPGATPIRAVAAFDSGTSDYGQQLINATINMPLHAPAGAYSSSISSFYSDREAWFEHDVTFNADRVRSALLFTFHGTSPDDPREFLGWAHTLGAYNVNRVPTEYVFFPEGDHGLLRPRERVEIMQLTMDWMNFWLKDIAPSDPARNARWEPLRPLFNEMLERPARVASQRTRAGHGAPSASITCTR